VYFLIDEVLKIKNQRLEYFKSFWNWNDLLIVCFSIVTVAMFALRTIFTKLAIKAVHESELGEFVNFNTIGVWNELFVSICSFIVFCATLKFLKLLRFNRRIGMLAACLAYVWKDLLSFGASFAIIFMAFTQFAFLIFGNSLESYKDFQTSLASAFRFSLGQFNLKELHEADYILGSLYFVLFILIVIFGLMSILITILTEAFEKVKEDLNLQTNEHEIVDYVFEMVKNVTSKKQKKKKIEERAKKLKEINEQSSSEASLRVTVKQNDNSNDLERSSIKSLYVNSHFGNTENQDSLSLY